MLRCSFPVADWRILTQAQFTWEAGTDRIGSGAEAGEVAPCGRRRQGALYPERAGAADRLQEEAPAGAAAGRGIAAVAPGAALVAVSAAAGAALPRPAGPRGEGAVGRCPGRLAGEAGAGPADPGVGAGCPGEGARAAAVCREGEGRGEEALHPGDLEDPAAPPPPSAPWGRA